MVNNFRGLKIWQKGYELLLDIYKITTKYPRSEKFGLVDQTRRSANGVIANIAETSGRYHYADKVRTLYMSRGESHETQSHLSVALGLKYISDKEFNSIDQEYEGLSKGINSYIRSLRSKNKT